ncbi:MAG: hypothetical protein LAO05_16135 [Acidobacteriia bacterium]|nr:hypothetical protein [Terriglobia bacterium]
MTAVLVSRRTTPLASSVVLLEGSSIGFDLTGFPVLDVPRAFAIGSSWLASSVPTNRRRA